MKSFTYTLHPTGRRTKIEENDGRVTDYVYDDLYRLTSESIADAVNGDHNSSYTYDKVGNRVGEVINGVTTAYSYDDNDSLLQTGGTVYTYDANGSTLTETLDSDVTTYGYNAKNELVTAQKVIGGVTKNLAYEYDITGIRVSSTVDNVTTNYLVDHNQDYSQVVWESDGSDVIIYTFGDDLLSQDADGVLYVFHYDGLGSTRALSTVDAVISNEYDFDAFGNELNADGSEVTKYLYAGEQRDSDLGLDYLRARYLNVGTGRFTQQDTWMGRQNDPITLNKYTYGNSNPVRYIDPSGRAGTLPGLNAALGVSSVLAGISIANYGGVLGNGDYDVDAGELSSYQVGILAMAAMSSSSSKIVEKLKEKFDDDGDVEYQFYHGTDGGTAVYLAGGGNIDAGAVARNQQWAASSGGFYLADDYDDAWHFGQFHTNSGKGFAVVQYDFTNFAYKTLEAVAGPPVPIPPADIPFNGDQFVIPVGAFGMFNNLKAQGEIKPSIHPDFRG